MSSRADDLQARDAARCTGLADRVVPADGAIALHALAGASDRT